MPNLWKCMVTSSKQIPHDFCKAALGSDWLGFSFHYGKTESDSEERGWRRAQKDWKKAPTPEKVPAPEPASEKEWRRNRQPVQTGSLVHAAVEAPYPRQDEEEKKGRCAGWRRWGSLLNCHWPDSWPRWPQRPGHQCPAGRNHPANHGRKGSQEGVSEGWKIKEALEVLAGDCGSPWDPLVPEEYWAPNP